MSARRPSVLGALAFASLPVVAACGGLTLDDWPKPAASQGDARAPDAGAAVPLPTEDAALVSDAAPSPRCVSAPLARSARGLVLVVDASQAAQAVWPEVSRGVRSFVDDPGTSAVALGGTIFPKLLTIQGTRYTACNVFGPDVPLGPAAETAGPLGAALSAKAEAGGGDSLDVTLQGAFAAASAFAANQPRHAAMDVAVVVVTASPSPTGCGTITRSGAAGLPGLVEGAFTSRPAVPVHFVVIGPRPGGASPVVDQLAALGGTGRAVFVEGDVASGVQGALADVRDGAFPCRFAPKDLELANADPARVAVVDGAGGVVPRVDTCGAGASAGWRFDDPAWPRSIVLCDGTCRDAEAGRELRVDPCGTAPPR